MLSQTRWTPGKIGIVSLGSVLAVLASGCSSEVEEPSATYDFVALTFNVGTPKKEDPNYHRRIRHRAYEAYLGERIQDVGAEIVTLQEVLSPHRCSRFEEDNPDHTCYGVSYSDPESAPVRRLLGPDYSIVCDSNANATCIGVHVNYGVIDGLPRGGIDLQGAETQPFPEPACEDVECEADDDVCVIHTSVSRVEVIPDDGNLGPFAVVNVHSNAFGERCRVEQTRQALTLVQEGKGIALGDWNFDPDRDEDPSIEVWSEYVTRDSPVDRPLSSHHPRMEVTDVDVSEADVDIEEPILVPTLKERALDRAVGSFTRGTCEVLNEPSLSEGFDFEGNGLFDEVEHVPDHAAVRCPLRGN